MRDTILLISCVAAASMMLLASAISKTKPENAAPSGQSGAAAMQQCQSMYAGRRGAMSRDRYQFIEECVKGMTGKTPAQLGLNCSGRGRC